MGKVKKGDKEQQMHNDHGLAKVKVVVKALDLF